MQRGDGVKLLNVFLVVLTLTFVMGCAKQAALNEPETPLPEAPAEDPVATDMTLVEDATVDETTAVDAAAGDMAQDLETW